MELIPCFRVRFGLHELMPAAEVRLRRGDRAGSSPASRPEQQHQQQHGSSLSMQVDTRPFRIRRLIGKLRVRLSVGILLIFTLVWTLRGGAQTPSMDDPQYLSSTLPLPNPVPPNRNDTPRRHTT